MGRLGSEMGAEQAKVGTAGGGVVCDGRWCPQVSREGDNRGFCSGREGLPAPTGLCPQPGQVGLPIPRHEGCPFSQPSWGVSASARWTLVSDVALCGTVPCPVGWQQHPWPLPP